MIGVLCIPILASEAKADAHIPIKIASITHDMECFPAPHTPSTVILTFGIGPDEMGGHEIGNTVEHDDGDVGFNDFSPLNEPDFNDAVALLTRARFDVRVLWQTHFPTWRCGKRP